MNQEIKTQWIAALKSGAYKQTTNRLRKGNSYCCLGVLCDLYIKETGKAGWINENYLITSNGEEHSSMLPDDIMKWADIKNPTGKCGYKSFPSSLMELNDRDKLDFKQIADVIEKEF